MVTIRWPKPEATRRATLSLIKHREEWRRRGNPLERIISLEAKGDQLTISTTNERLAQRIGRALERAFHGKAAYQWSRENKLLRVQWSQKAAPA